jgi:hypothetical protein
MTKEKFKLIGQLIDDKESTILIITDNWMDLISTVQEYKTVYPDIFLNIELGYFKTPISNEKKKAIANLLSILNSPLTNLFSLL